jgi:hypothetical protein
MHHKITQEVLLLAVFQPLSQLLSKQCQKINKKKKVTNKCTSSMYKIRPLGLLTVALTENTWWHYNTYCLLLPTWTAAILLTMLCKLCVRIFGCDSHPYSQPFFSITRVNFNLSMWVLSFFKLLATIHCDINKESSHIPILLLFTKIIEFCMRGRQKASLQGT